MELKPLELGQRRENDGVVAPVELQHQTRTFNCKHCLQLNVRV